MSRVLLLVNKGQSEIDALQKRGLTRARRLAIAIRRAALHAFQTRKMPDIRKVILDQMVPTMRDAMMASHLRGLLAERAILEAASKKAGEGLQLSVFDAAVRAMANLTGVNTRALQLQYQTQAIRVMHDVSDEVDAKLRETIKELIEEGAHINEARKVLGQTLNRLGMSQQEDYRLETIYRTQMQMAYGAGKWEAAQDPDVQEILWGYTYSAVNDDRTRPEHEALDGTTLPKDDPIWEKIWPPNGWNCRCQVIPIFEEVAKVEPKTMPDGSQPQPDDGFAFNPGRVFSTTHKDRPSR